MGVVPVILICLLASVGVSHGHTAIVGATLMDGNGGLRNPADREHSFWLLACAGPRM